MGDAGASFRHAYTGPAVRFAHVAAGIRFPAARNSNGHTRAAGSTVRTEASGGARAGTGSAAPGRSVLRMVAALQPVEQIVTDDVLTRAKLVLRIEDEPVARPLVPVDGARPLADVPKINDVLARARALIDASPKAVVASPPARAAAVRETQPVKSSPQFEPSRAASVSIGAVRVDRRAARRAAYEASGCPMWRTCLRMGWPMDQCVYRK